MKYFILANMGFFHVMLMNGNLLIERKKQKYLPLYPKMATVIVSKAHKMYNNMIENFSAQLFLHLVHCVPS